MNMIEERKTNSQRIMPTLYITGVTMVLIQLVIFLQFKSTESASTIAKPGCQDSCGGVPIPYPFGIGPSCFQSNEFNVTCETTYYNNGKPTPKLHDLYPILDISLSLGQARIDSPVSSQCYNTTTKKDDNYFSVYAFNRFWINNKKNKFTVIGCNTLANLAFDDLTINYSIGCLSSCDSLDTLNMYDTLNMNGSCNGIGCCQTDLSRATQFVLPSFDDRYKNSDVYYFSPCRYAMVVEEAQFKFNTTYITTDWLKSSRGHSPVFNSQPLPMVLDWTVGKTTCDIEQKNKSSYECISSNSVCLNSTRGYGGYLCNCSDGYEGNPYLNAGCQDIEECLGQNACSKPAKCHNFEGGYSCSCPLGWRSNPNNPSEYELNLTLLIGMTAVLGFGTAFSIILLYYLIAKHIKLFEKRKRKKLKHKFFIQNRGLLLQQQIASQQGTTQKMRNFKLQELEKATNRFDNALIIGRGGHGEVYKGILPDQRVVAIKKSKIIDQAEIDQFINEVVILSQVNHRNVVKLYGCCLETEVPLLVYEFISNGTLFNYLHVEEHCSLAWKHRLRIALEAAGAISYLHSSASISVFHRDIKSSNILLDDYFTAKVSDFGASRSVQIDQTGVTTAIQGTHGYLDPEYYYTGRLTPKSDVYSFGVILAELLTREKPLISSRMYEGGSLIAYFRSAMRENRLFEILDPQVVNEGHITELEDVAKLAEMCLRMKGEERPTMKEVEIRLEVLWRSNQQQIHPWRSQSLEERQLMLLYHNAGIDTETLLSEQSRHDREIRHTCNCFNIDKEAEESIAIGR